MLGRLFSLLAVSSLLVAASSAVERPFILWTKSDIAAIRERIDGNEWAAKEYEQLLQRRGHGDSYRRLFRYLVKGDEKAGQEEKNYLLSFIGAGVDSRPWSDQYMTALRYDCLYDELSPDERERLESTMRRHVEHQIESDRRLYTKHNWLPNMQWPRPFSAHLLALALQDRDAIERIASSNGGWKYYFDSYVSDGGFYNEEFGKMYSMVGEMLLWCRGLERLGMDELGFGYVGKNNHGACMRSYLASLFKLGMPRVDMGEGEFFYPRLSMGDAKGGTLQHALTRDVRFRGSNMNGRDHRNRIVSKMMETMWFEIGHKKWPKDGYDYLLACTVEPGADTYFPSLFWGLDPVNVSTVTPPPAPSGLYPERGFAVLHSEEGPGYWSGPWPAVGLRLATPYVHSVPDVFALTGFFAFNQPIYVNRQVSPGYAGTDPGWSASIRSHCAFMVDNAEPRTVGIIPAMFRYTDDVKIVSATATNVYPDVVQSRTLLLTKEYLLDITILDSDRARSFKWFTHTLGRACPDNPQEWARSHQLVGSIYDLDQEQSFVAGDRPWSVTAWQKPFADRGGADRIGVRISMLGSPGTVAYLAKAPMVPDARDRLDYGAQIVGHPSVVASRNATRTTFIALHEPFRNTWRIKTFRPIRQTDEAFAVAIAGEGFSDRVMVSRGVGSGSPVTLVSKQTVAGDASAESATFSGIAFARMDSKGVRMSGDIRGAAFRSNGPLSGNVSLNGKPVSAEVQDGCIAYGSQAGTGSETRSGPGGVREPVGSSAAGLPGPWSGDLKGAVASWWYPETVRLATGGSAVSQLVLRNNGLEPVSEVLELKVGDGISVEPSVLNIDAVAPGKEVSFAVKVNGARESANRASHVKLVGGNDGPVPIQRAMLGVVHGLVTVKEQVWPRQFVCKVTGPRYEVQYDFLKTTAAVLLLGPDGHRRFRGGNVYPTLYRMGTDSRGQERPQEVTIGGFSAFKPNYRSLGDEAPLVLDDSGTHPHGYRSDFEYRFTEDWIWIRYKNPGRVAYDWSDRRSRKTFKGTPHAVCPELTMILDEEGRKVDARDIRRYKGPASAMFDRPNGSAYGAATFYPPESSCDGGLVWQAADKPMAFTFCSEEEFPVLHAKWRERGTDPSLSTWGQGDMR